MKLKKERIIKICIRKIYTWNPCYSLKYRSTLGNHKIYTEKEDLKNVYKYIYILTENNNTTGCVACSERN